MMLKHLLIAGAPNAVLAQSNEYTSDDYPATPAYSCVARYCFDDESRVELTPAEQERLDHLKAKMARIIADAGARMEARQANKKAQAELEAKKEAIRRQQCAVALLWIEIGCPPREDAGS